MAPCYLLQTKRQNARLKLDNISDSWNLRPSRIYWPRISCPEGSSETV